MPRLLFLFIGLGLLLGCNARPSTYPVQGRVMWKGGGEAKELVGYTVTFEAEDGKTSGSGDIQSDGTFVIGTFHAADGAIAGKHRVALTPPDSPSDGLPPPTLVDRRFGRVESSGLSAEIQHGRTSVVLEVERARR